MTTFAFSAGSPPPPNPSPPIKEALSKVGIPKTGTEFNTMKAQKTLPFFTDTATAWLPAHTITSIYTLPRPTLELRELEEHRN